MKFNVFRLLLSAACASTILGCGATIEQLRSRASFDLNCAENKLQVVEIDQRTRGVRGCGKQATYVENCTTPGRDRNSCTWVMNTESR
jgi:hypothetical protein